MTVSASGMHWFVPHCWKPELQAKPHVLAAHVGCAFDTGVVQTSRQVPQLFRSVVVSVHSVGIPVAGGVAGHAVSPAVQCSVHLLLAHAA